MWGNTMKSILKYGFIILGCAFLGALACEDVDLEGEDAGSVQGFWELRQTTGSNTFLSISDTEVIFYYYDANKNCITVDAYEVVRIDGTGFYILAQDGLEENRVLAISRNGDRIHVRDIEETQREIDRYWISEVDISTLAPICVDPTDVFGEWELTQEDGNTIYLSVAEDSIKVIDKSVQFNCYFVSALEVISFDGNQFILTDNDPNSATGQQEVKFIRTLEGLEVERIEDGNIVKELYLQSEADFSTFNPLCELGPLEELQGKWRYENTETTEQDGEFYFTIGSDFFAFHFLVGDPINDPDNVCFEIERFEIISVGRNTVTVRQSVTPFEEIVFKIDFKPEEGLLYLEDNSDVLTFTRTDIDEAYINNQCSVTTDN